MLDRCKLMQELRILSDKLFVDSSAAYQVAYEVWQRIITDATFIHKVYAIQGKTPWLVPTWSTDLNETYTIKQDLEQYRILSIDGSQIYPDKHQGTSCYLLNIGSVMITYGDISKKVALHTTPSVYVPEADDMFASSTELVNCMRQELEFTRGLELSKKMLHETPSDAPFLFLFDGSLIFWHLESKDMQLKDAFLSRYLLSLQQMYQAGILIAGYISLPKNKELLNLIRLEMCNFDVENTQSYKEVDALIDTNVANFFLEPYSRSTLFKNHAKICAQYPDHLHPHFFYLHVGTEIGRVEIPAWIAADQAKVDTIARIILDQSIKGRGYPVALAEAHEQAVVKGPDREFFYQLINKIGFEQNQRLVMSQKSIKKRGIGI